MDHRAKNLLTVIQSVLRLTRSSGTVEEFRAAVTGRIQALGRVHTLLAESRWEAIQLDALVRRELEPFGAGIRIGAITPGLRIQPNMAQAIGMILHELATNSVKHGAIAGTGQVDFACVFDPGALRPALRPRWGPGIPAHAHPPATNAHRMPLANTNM